MARHDVARGRGLEKWLITLFFDFVIKVKGYIFWGFLVVFWNPNEQMADRLLSLTEPFLFM